MGKILNKNKIEEMHNIALRILEKVGVIFESDRAIKTFSKHGAKVDGNRVFIPSNLVEETYKAIPKSVQFNSEELAGGIQNATALGSVPAILDDETGKIRRANIHDVVKICKLIQTNPLYKSTHNSIEFPDGNDSKNVLLGQASLWLRFSDKSNFASGFRAFATPNSNKSAYQEQRDLVQFIRRFHGGKDHINLSQSYCPTSPLLFDSEVLENLFASIDEDVPVCISPSTSTGVSGPVRLMDITLMDIALAVAGLVLCQLERAGMSVNVYSASCMADLRSMQPSVSSAESTYIICMTYEYFEHFDIPSGVGINISDSAKVDYQAGFETAFSTLTPLLATNVSNFDAYTGNMAAWFAGSFEKMILDEDTINMYNRFLRGVDTTIKPDFFEEIEEGVNQKSFMLCSSIEDYRNEHYMTTMFQKFGSSESLPREKVDIKYKAREEIHRRLENYVEPEKTLEQKKMLQEYLPTAYKFDFQIDLQPLIMLQIP